jgi:pantoate--beta-alanine ligase
VLQFKKVVDLNHYLNSLRPNNSIGFVPTMGALHNGHLSLIKEAKKNNPIVVCSIFVNPTQFNNPNDLKTYPKTIEADLLKLLEVDCDIVFLPDESEIYSDQGSNIDFTEYGNLIKVLEAEHRPGHFNGVIDVVTRLFKIVEPNQVYFGQKDFQQCMVVKKLIEVNQLNIIFNICPSIREKDGIAMSSRNVKLNSLEREAATLLSKALFYIKDNITENFGTVKEGALNLLSSNNLIELEYLKVCEPSSLEEINTFKNTAVVLIAAKIGSTRLIDNITIGF